MATERRTDSGVEIKTFYTGADLTGADLAEAALDGADLTGVTLTGEQQSAINTN